MRTKRAMKHEPRNFQIKGNDINQRWNVLTKRPAIGFSTVSCKPALHVYPRITSLTLPPVHLENNLDSAPDELDLHGLHVAEAIERTEKAIQLAQSAGKDHLNIIVGKVRSVTT